MTKQVKDAKEDLERIKADPKSAEHAIRAAEQAVKDAEKAGK